MLMLRFLGKHTLRQRCMEGFLLEDNIWNNPLHISTCGRHVGSRTCQVENWDALQSQRISEDNHAYLLQLRKRPGLPAHVQASLARLSFTGVAFFFYRLRARTSTSKNRTTHLIEVRWNPNSIRDRQPWSEGVGWWL